MNKKENNKNNKKSSLYLVITLLGILLIIITIFGLYTTKKNKEEKEKNISYTDLIKEINAENVKKVEMTIGSTSVKITLKNDEEKKSIVPSTQAFIELIQEKVKEGNEINLEQKKPSILITIFGIVYDILPLILMILIVMVLVYEVQGLGDKSKVYDGQENKSDVKFSDIAGLEEEKAEMVEIVDFLKEPDRFYDMGAKIPKGILLYGKPGTGKTLIAKAIAGEAGVPFISMSGSEFIEMFAGLGASRVRSLFKKARKMSPCIVFIDEIDAIGSRRTSNSGSDSENNQTLNQLLVEMDGFEKNETIIVLAATNRPEMLDKALLRPGRFDRQITIAPPDVRGREEILKIHSKEKKFADDVTLKSIAEDTAGYTGAELANILNESAIIATVNKHEVIEQEDIEEAVKKVTVGIQKKARVISDKEKKLTAYHEAGHAIVGRFLNTGDPLKEISIIPRGVARADTLCIKPMKINFIVQKQN